MTIEPNAGMNPCAVKLLAHLVHEYYHSCGQLDSDGQRSVGRERVPVPVDTESLKQLAEATGGQSFQAESANDLNQAYAELGGKIGYDLELVEITWKFIAVGIAGLMCASALSLWWFRRLT